MLKEDKKLNKLWKNAKKIKNKRYKSMITLDMRYNSSKEFIDCFQNKVIDSVKENSQKYDLNKLIETSLNQ